MGRTINAGSGSGRGSNNIPRGGGKNRGGGQSSSRNKGGGQSRSDNGGQSQGRRPSKSQSGGQSSGGQSSGQCPGEELQACIDVCPGFSARVFGACVAGCAKRCPAKK